ncbi:MAG: tetratricopeptide repeat protein [Candidatus Omnitrophota bacterium]|jgi:Flp pilus assembly protein TadD
MPKSRQIVKITKIILAIGFVFFILRPVQAANVSSASNNGDKITAQANETPPQLQDMARGYRDQGLTAQNSGDINTAMKYYQKAIELDSYYAAPYNDLGVLYEAGGSIDRAEQSYLKAIEINPDYLSAYTNLALFYENKRDLNKAGYYWQKRAQLGQPDDFWTQKASQRAEDLRVVMSATPIKDAREQEVLGLMKDISANRSLLNQDNTALANDHFQKAKRYYNKGDLASAFKEALDAQYLDQNNSEIEEFLDKIQERALSK